MIDPDTTEKPQEKSLQEIAQQLKLTLKLSAREATHVFFESPMIDWTNTARLNGLKFYNLDANHDGQHYILESDQSIRLPMTTPFVQWASDDYNFFIAYRNASELDDMKVMKFFGSHKCQVVKTTVKCIIYGFKSRVSFIASRSMTESKNLPFREHFLCVFKGIY